MKIQFHKTSIVYTIWIMLFVICSGSCIGLIYAKYFDISYVVFGIFVGIFGKHSLRKRDLYTLLIFCLFYLLNFLVNISGAPNYNAYISYVIRMVGTLFLINTIDSGLFERKYTRIIIIIAALSLMVFVAYNFWGYAPIKSINGFNLIGPFNIQVYYRRDSGIFWEPGAYQFFLNLALFYLLKEADWNLFKNKSHFVGGIILIISILTSQSTTGYFILLLIALVYFYKNWKKMSKISKIAMTIPIFVMIVLIIANVLASNTVAGKFNSENASYNIRMIDLKGTFELLMEEFPVLGYGFQTTTLERIYATKGIVRNSVGILSCMMSMGILYTAVYLKLIIKQIRARNNYWIDKQLEVMIILLVCFSEAFFQYPILFAFLFSFNRNSDSVSLNNSI